MHTAPRGPCVINFSELDQSSFHHCPLQKGLLFPLPTAASNFVEDVAEYIQSQEPSDISQGITHGPCIPFQALVSPLPPPPAGSPHPAQHVSSNIYQAPVGGVHSERICPLEEPCRQGQLILPPKVGQYQPASSLSPLGNRGQAEGSLCPKQKMVIKRHFPGTALKTTHCFRKCSSAGTFQRNKNIQVNLRGNKED